MKLSLLLSILFTISLTFQIAIAQVIDQKTDRGGVTVDDNGVMRWVDNNEEIKGFGGNYTVPFAHAYRSANKLGIDPLKAIDQDVYHFSRLGLDLYRVHVWDTEISDSLGNLIINEHLNAFDYLLKKLSERNINYVITPIAYWGNGWPEPDESTPGFSNKYGKDGSLTNANAIKAQENYLSQFMDHVNPYTQTSYKNDPHLIAVEISNEPHHREEAAKVTVFIKGMVNSIRKTGYKKPIFYNTSHSVHLIEDYFKANIQGGTFQWYPTGLGYQKELSGNLLVNVDDYNIPFDASIKKYKGAKLVYEFDAADVGKSYIYPAMARSFREAGIQIATHFSYDPMFLAYANTEYNTHYMNLAYTPSKAISLKICSEIFHNIPMYKDFGSYPENSSFDDFFVNYEQDLAMFNTEEKYFYTNNTIVKPKNESKLSHIAGKGNSPMVNYDGTGAYFLDKLEDGIWRLEVMPDALIIDNPYGRNSLDKKVAVVQWNKKSMEIKLKNLSSNFNIKPLNDGNMYLPKITDGKFMVSPGTYLITKAGVKNKWKASDTWQNIKLNEFQAPESSVDKTYLIHENVDFATADTPYTIEAKVISPDTALTVQVQVTSEYNWKLIDMKRKDGFNYTAEIPRDQMNKGFLTYYIYVKSRNKVETFPAGKSGFPYDWYFYDRTPYKVRVIEKEQPIYLFNAQEDWSDLSYSWWSKESKLIPTDQINESEYQINVNKLFKKDNENLNGKVIYDYTVKYYVNDKISHLRKQLPEKKTLIIKARSINSETETIQVAIVTKDGTAYGKQIEIGKGLKEYEIPIIELEKVKTITMPRPYPSFLPYYFISKSEKPINIEDIESIQISIGPGLSKSKLEDQHNIGIVSLMLK